MSEPEGSWGGVLDAALRREELALLRLSRRVTQLLEQFGAYVVRKDWSTSTHDIVLDLANRWAECRGRIQAASHIESVTKNRFWGLVLDLMGENDQKANDLFFPTVRRLLAKWDGPRRLEACWDDVVQETAQQIWEQWRRGGVDKPWALLCTIAKRRFLDRVRATRDGVDLPEEVRDEGGAEAGGGGLFTGQALAILEAAERNIIVRMDLEGHTRLEVARELGMTEGEVLSIRRAGLRRIWRWIGRDLPPRLRAVWEEMFKGAKRATPDEVAEKLGIPREEVLAILCEARTLTGVG